MAARNLVQLGIRLSKFRLSKFQEINAGVACNRLQSSRDLVNLYSSSSSNSSGHRLDYRQISQLVTPIGKRGYLVDTLKMVRSLEAQGIPSKHAEAITSTVTEVLHDSLEYISQNFISKVEMQKIEMAQEANLSKFKFEIQNYQEHHFALLQREVEKLRHDIGKMRGELRYEIDKATAGLRLDLNLKRGGIPDELTNQSVETTNLTNKLDRGVDVSKKQAKVREGTAHPDMVLKLEAAEIKLQDLKSNVATLGKEAAAAMAAVESQQQRLTLQRLIAMVEAERAYHQRVLQILGQIEGENMPERQRIEAAPALSMDSMPAPPPYEELNGVSTSPVQNGSTDSMGYFLGEVMYSYQAETDVELNLSVGDYVVVRTVANDGWAEGFRKGKAGWFPFGYIERRDHVLASKVAEVF